MKFCLSLILLFVVSQCQGQFFVNGDLEGTISNTSLPAGWLAVPMSDAASMATIVTLTTPDVCGTSGPNLGGGIAGAPYSGNTFVSGLLGYQSTGSTGWGHEGIRQVADSLLPGETYCLEFYQAVVKQNNALDSSGSWSVYMDNTLIGTTSTIVSNKNFMDLQLDWHQATLQFVASSTSHTFKFLPNDDDANPNFGNDLDGALRMGIDSVSISESLNCSSVDIHERPKLPWIVSIDGRADQVVINTLNHVDNGIIRITNELGQSIVSASFSGTKLILDSSALPKGLVLVQLFVDGKRFAKKLVVL